MAEAAAAAAPLGPHGAAKLPAVEVDSYNLEIKDEDGFLGDRASKGAFRAIIEDWRKRLRKTSSDPFGDTPSAELSKKTIDEALEGDDLDAAGLMQAAVEDYAKELAFVLQRFLKTKEWKGTESVVIGGGLSDSRAGERAIARASVLLKAEGLNIKLQTIAYDPDDAGLIGAVQLAPSWMFGGHDSILAVDIGGTNMRAGVVELNLKKAPDLSKAAVWKRDLWRHRDDKPRRNEAIDEVCDMLRKLISAAEKQGLKLAPFIGIGCPGVIEPDGSIDRGAQNLPGNWESSRFNLPTSLVEAIPVIGEHETIVVVHNDAVVQGLSHVPFMIEHDHWGVLTIGTGLGNARFSNRTKPTPEADKKRGSSKKKNGKKK
jgi:predicted NBD/HSP70 family sugar kinase